MGKIEQIKNAKPSLLNAGHHIAKKTHYKRLGSKNNIDSYISRYIKNEKAPKPNQTTVVKQSSPNAPVSEKEQIEQEAARLTAGPSKSQVQLTKIAYTCKRFDGVMKELNLPNVVTVTNIVHYISHLSLGDYANRYIQHLVRELKNHVSVVNLTGKNWYDMFNSETVQRALSKAGILESKEDNRIPLTPKLIHQMSTIFDRDLDPYTAILFKAMVSFGTFCMARISEMCSVQQESNQSNDHAVTAENVSLSYKERGVTVTFLHSKSARRPQTIFFQAAPLFEEAFDCISNYAKVRPSTKGSDPFFLLADCSRVSYHYFTRCFNHAVDHSDWIGLNVASHSMRIAGASIRYKNKVQPAFIMRLGRWSSESFLRYLREAWLEDPEALRASGKFATKRNGVAHEFCQCPTSITYKPVLKDHRRQNLQVQSKARAGIIPQNVATQQKIFSKGVFAQPVFNFGFTGVMLDDNSENWLKKFFNADSRWFTVAAYLAASRIGHKRRAITKTINKNPNIMPAWKIIPNTSYISDADREVAKKWLNEYDAFVAATSLVTLKELKTISTRLPNNRLFPNFTRGTKEDYQVLSEV